MSTELKLQPSGYRCRYCGTDGLQWNQNPLTGKYWLGDQEGHLHRCKRPDVPLRTPTPRRPREGKVDAINPGVYRQQRAERMRARSEKLLTAADSFRIEVQDAENSSDKVVSIADARRKCGSKP